MKKPKYQIDRPETTRKMKRLTETEKWSDKFFRTLSPENKILYLYVLDNCNLAGVYKPDIKLAEFQTGAKFNLVDEDVPNCLKSKIHLLESGNWFVKNFIKFQQPNIDLERLLNSKFNVFKKIEKELRREGILKFADENLNFNFASETLINTTESFSNDYTGIDTGVSISISISKELDKEQRHEISTISEPVEIPDQPSPKSTEEKPVEEWVRVGQILVDHLNTRIIEIGGVSRKRFSKSLKTYFKRALSHEIEEVVSMIDYFISRWYGTPFEQYLVISTLLNGKLAERIDFAREMKERGISPEQLRKTQSRTNGKQPISTGDLEKSINELNF